MVSNSPCGVESIEGYDQAQTIQEFLIHRVELKAFITVSKE